MFNALNPRDKKSVVDAIVPVKKHKGDVVIQQGDDGDSFYFLEQGSLTCSKVFPGKTESTFLKEYHRKCFYLMLGGSDWKNILIAKTFLIAENIFDSKMFSGSIVFI